MEKKVFSLYDLPIEVLYPNKPSIEENWPKWLELFDEDHKEFVFKLRNSYSDIEQLGIRVLEITEPLDINGCWVQQYPYDYVRQKYPELHNNKIPHVIFAYKIDGRLHLCIDPEYGTECSLHHLTDSHRKLFAEYIFLNFLGRYVYDDANFVRFVEKV
jgi:hypothetical protein